MIIGMASSDMHDRHSLRIILPRRLTAEPSPDKRLRERSLSNQSSISPISTRHSLQPSRSSSFHRQLGSVIDIGTNSSDGNDDDDDWDDSISMRQNYRFGSQTIRMRRRSSHYSHVHQQQLLASDKHDSFVIPMTNERFTAVTVTTPPSNDLRGQTLLHLAARLGHDEILRLLISETSQASILMNKRGQTSLLTAIEAGSTNSATLLMESDPRSITISDNNGSNVFHYACEHCNDVVLNRAIALLKRLNSSSDRIRGLRRITERNDDGKTAFDIAIEKGQLKCIKQFLLSSWLVANIDVRELINADSLRNAVDENQLDILAFFVTDAQRFAYIIHLLINVQERYFNLLEYAIYMKKKDIIRLFVSVRIPVEQYTFREQYKSFLQHYNEPFVQPGALPFYQTPLQRMLSIPECVTLVPLMLEQFVDNNGIDFSIIDDCLYAQPGKTRCMFGQEKDFSTRNWLQQHPLTLIAKADCKAIYDHQLVRMCVDLKFNLFGNFLYFIILCGQSIYVTLYTGITLGSPTPANQNTSYYQMTTYSCNDLCLTLANDPINPAQDRPSIRALRLILLIVSGLSILKEFHQVFTEREKYFRRFYINLIELHMYVSAIIYCVDINECTRQTGIRCSIQWMTGGIGLLSVWTSLLFVVMNGIKFGKHGLLFVTVYVTFLKFIAVYIFIWIGYILAFYMICKDILDQFRFFNFIPKLLVMFIGEYDLDTLFFSNNNRLLPGSEAALILYSAYVFTMFIVMMNIMGGLAVADVKEFRLNAKREHLRSRIGVVLGFQAYLGGLCETIGAMTMRLCRNQRWLRFLEKYHLSPMKYQLEKIEIRTYPINTSHSSVSGVLDQIFPEAGFYVHQRTGPYDLLYQEDENTRLSKKTDEIRDVLEESTTRSNNELRKIALNLQNELEDIKRRLNR